ncbi:17538_t:CDS:1, partial [Racocetra fulgida]
MHANDSKIKIFIIYRSYHKTKNQAIVNTNLPTSQQQSTNLTFLSELGRRVFGELLNDDLVSGQILHRIVLPDSEQLNNLQLQRIQLIKILVSIPKIDKLLHEWQNKINSLVYNSIP